MSEWYMEQVFATRTWKLRKEVFCPQGHLGAVMLDEDFDASHFAAYRESEVIGVLTLRSVDNDYEILFFAVHPDVRNQGVGTALLRYAYDFVKTVAGHALLVKTTRGQQHFWIERGFLPRQPILESSSTDTRMFKKCIDYSSSEG